MLDQENLNSQSEISLAKQILNIFLPYERHLSVGLSYQANNAFSCLQIHFKKILAFVNQKLPIHFVLPAFPAKSPNRRKTYGPLPDLGERLALQFLHNLCQQISQSYVPGAALTICSDGRVFNDLIKVNDNDVALYMHEINAMLIQDKLVCIKTFGLDTIYAAHCDNYAKMRDQLVQEYGVPLAVIKHNVQSNHIEKKLFCGINRFIFEDQFDPEASAEWPSLRIMSKTQTRKIAKIIAYLVIQRSHAWSNLIERQFPQAVRLSIHPQPCGSKKLGIMLLKSKDRWATPWHSVLLQKDDQSLLVKKHEAEKCGATPIYIDNRFSHYVL